MMNAETNGHGVHSGFWYDHSPSVRNPLANALHDASRVEKYLSQAETQTRHLVGRMSLRYQLSHPALAFSAGAALAVD